MKDRLQRLVDAFNAEVRLGQRVRYWRFGKSGAGQIVRLTGEAFLLGGHTPAASVAGFTGFVALSQLEPIMQSEAEA